MTRILVLDNMAGEEEETAIVRVRVDSGSTQLVQEGISSSLQFTIPAEPTVSLNYTGSSSVAPSSFNRMTIELNRAASRAVAVYITGVETGDVTYDDGNASPSWKLEYRVLPAGMSPSRVNFTSDTTCNSATMVTDCVIDIPREQTVVDMRITFSGVSSGDSVAVTLGVASAGLNFAALGTPSTHTLTAQ